MHSSASAAVPHPKGEFLGAKFLITFPLLTQTDVELANLVP